MSDDEFDGLVDSPTPVKKKSMKRIIRVDSDSDSDDEITSPSPQKIVQDSLGLNKFAFKKAPEPLRVNATSDSGWITRSDSPEPDYYKKGRQTFKRTKLNDKKGSRQRSGGRLKKKEMSSSEDEEDSFIEKSSDEDEVDLEKESDKAEEELSESNSESDGNGDEEDVVDICSSDDEESRASVLSKNAQDKLAQCRKISIKLRDALSKWETKENSEDGNGCLDMTTMATAALGHEEEEDEDNPDDEYEEGSDIETPVKKLKRRKSIGGNWAPVDASVIEEQCQGLTTIKPYQVVGVNWLLLLHQQNVSGVLADDMGLGKTVQTIAFFAMLRVNALKKYPYSPPPTHLVVVPASVLNNWMAELEKFAPHLHVTAYHGSLEARAVARRLARENQDNPVDVVVTTYSYFERESASDDRRFFRQMDWEYLVLDEAHGVKNMKTARWTHLKSIKSRNRLFLSGTPVQNNLRELMVLLDFLSPKVFNFKSTMSQWGEVSDQSDPVGAFLTGLGLTEDGEAQEGAQDCLLQIRTLLAPFVLRRLKSQVMLQLGSKTSHIVRLTPDEKQKTLYDAILMRHVERMGAKKGKSKKGDELTKIVGSAKEARNVFVELRKAANHPLLLREHYKDDHILENIGQKLFAMGHFGDQCTMEMVRTEISGYCDLDLHHLCVEYGGSLQQFELPMEVLFESCKMNKLRSLVPSLIAEGHRVLIFSQWTKLLDILELLMHHLAIGFERLDGSTAVSERQEMIDSFNSDHTKKVFLLSTRAGGLGINLTSADTVIIHDVDFNPVNDRQAEDRCHRIGQTKPVSVYKLVADGTVDARILEIGTRKSQVNSTLLDSAESSVGISVGDNQGQAMSALLKEALKSFLS